MDKADKKIHINFWYIIAAVLGMMLVQNLYLESTKLTPIPYSRFQTLLNEDKVAQIGIAQNYISGSLKEAQPDGVKDFITTRVDPDLAQNLDKHGVTIAGWSRAIGCAISCPGSCRRSFLSGSGCSRSGAWGKAGPGG